MRVFSLILGLAIAAGALGQTCYAVISVATESTTFFPEAFDQPRSDASGAILALAAAVAASAMVMRQPRRAALVFGGGAFVAAVLGVAMGGDGTLFFWAAALSLATFFAFMGESELRPERATLAGGTPLCGKCGRILDDDDRFCTHCGTPRPTKEQQ